VKQGFYLAWVMSEASSHRSLTLQKASGGHLGRILQIEANFSHDKFMTLNKSNWRPGGSSRGDFATGIHLTDWSVKLLGAAYDVRVSSETLASDFRQGDTFSAYVRSKGGGTAYVSATLVTPFVPRFAVFGTKGWIDVRDKAHVEAPAGWIITRASVGSLIEISEVGPAKPVRENLVAFARAVRDCRPMRSRAKTSSITSHSWRQSHGQPQVGKLSQSADGPLDSVQLWLPYSVV
jgi:predicted dehydrogenase